MNITTVIFVLVLLLTLAVPFFAARGPQGPRRDDFVDAPYTTIPPEETPTEGLGWAVATKPPGMCGDIGLADSETDTPERIQSADGGHVFCYPDNREGEAG